MLCRRSSRRSTIRVAAAVIALSWVGAGFPPPALGELAHRFEYSFRGSAPIPPPLAGFGPEADKVLRPTPQGLRIELPAGRTNKGGVGITPRFRLSGDFEIIVKYELLYADKPSAGLGSGIKLWLQFDSPREDAATLAHLLTAQGQERILAIHGQKAVKQKMKGEEARSKKGTLKIERKGSEVVMYDGTEAAGELREIRRFKMPTGDLDSVRISANTHGDAGKVGICITDIALAAERQPGAVAHQPGRTPWLLLAVAATIVGGGAASGFVYVRRRHRARIES